MSQIERVKQKPREEQVYDQNNHGGHDECSNRGAAYSGGPAFDSKPLMTTYGRNDESEDNWFREAYNKISKSQRMDGARPELFCAEMQRDTCDHPSAKQSCTIPHCHEQGEH